MELTVVIPTFNQAGLLRAALQAMTAQTLGLARYEIVVVDDGSADDTRDVLAAASIPGGVSVRVIRHSENRGRSAARNTGIREARAPLIVFIDSDVVVRPDFLESHLRTLRRYGPGVVSRGPVVLVDDPAEAARARVPRLMASPAYLDTANAGLEREALIRAGMFDEAFPGYGWEDFELGLRLKRIGVRRVFSPRAAAFHVQPPVRPDMMPALLRKEEARARSAAYFLRKHPALQTRFLIQATPLHGAAFWVGAIGGALTASSAAALARRLEQAGLPRLAHLALRGVLNRHYYRSLTAELTGHAAELA